QQEGIGRLRPQPRRHRMAFQVVDRDQRQTPRQRRRLAVGQADHDPAHQPRPRRRRHAVQRAPVQPGLAHGPARHAVDHLHMAAGGDFGHHPAIGRMVVDLAVDDAGQHLRARRRQPNHRGGGLVAAGLQAQHGQGRSGCPRPAPPFATASRRDSTSPAHRHPTFAPGPGPVRHDAARHRPRPGRARGRGRNPGSPRRDRHHRRPHPGPPPAGSRRQGPVHQGDRRGPAGRPRRCRRPLDEGRPRRTARGSGHRRRARARRPPRRLHQRPLRDLRRPAAGRPFRHRFTASTGSGASPAPRPEHRDAARQRRHPAEAPARRRLRRHPAGLFGPQPPRPRRGHPPAPAAGRLPARAGSGRPGPADARGRRERRLDPRPQPRPHRPRRR
uniref:DNA-directed DNA polymerase n=1 Tax=Parastrongyloides trichosuri TaxID=131310 RepID=A0A0N4ZGS8_PARTI